jgi:hypothetical protein
VNKQLRFLNTLALLTLSLLLVSCGSFSITTELQEEDKEPTANPIKLATPASMQPAAGICAEGQGEVVTMRVNPYAPDPRCLQVRSDQRLSVFNGLEVQLEISLGELTATIESGGEYTFEIPFGQIFLPGVHDLGTSSCCGGAIWLKGEGSAEPPEATSTVAVSVAATPKFQGHLEFPYIAADAGNFSLQAGEEMVITWLDPPFGAETYEIRFIRDDDYEEGLTMISSLPAGGIQAVWLVPERVSGRLEGVALFAGGGEVRSGCCAQVFTGELPPAGICSLRIHGIGVQNLYQEASDTSHRIAGIAPGLYLEVLGCTVDGWYFVQADQVITPSGSESVNLTGWMNGREQVSLHGPCEDIPFVED